MSNVDALIVKVNPGATTLGALNPGSIAGKFRKNVLNEGYSNQGVSVRKLFRVVFGPTGIAASTSRVILTARMMTGIFMILSGFILGSQLGYAYHPIATFAVMAGGMLIPGIATRLTMAAGVVIFAVAGFGMSLPGTIPGVELILSGLCLLMALAGPGRFSSDAVIRRNIFRWLRRRDMRIGIEQRASYKAFHYAERI